MPRVNITRAQELESYIYRQLERAMKFLGITQKEAGEVIGITQQGFCYAFKGRTLTIEQMCQLIDHMGLGVCIESR